MAARLPSLNGLRAFESAARHLSFTNAASELNEPELLDMVQDGWPVYAWPYGERHAWTTPRAPLPIRTVSKITGSANQ